MSSGEGSRRSPRKLLAVAVPVIALGALAVSMRLLDTDGAAPESATTLAASRVASDAARFEAPAGDAAAGGAGEAPAAPAPVDIAPRVAEPAAPVEQGRDVRGLVLRASDHSPVFWATVGALQIEGPGRETILVRARSDANGLFALHSPQAIDGFSVSVPAPGAGRDDTRPARPVPVRVEWAGGDTQGHEVRLEVDTGWRLDLQLRDAAGQSRAGVSVSAAGVTATSDAEGRCVLLDLPAGDPALQLSLMVVPGEAAVTRSVAAPAKGGLRGEATLTLP